MLSPAEIGSLRHQLWQAGFHCIPIENAVLGDKNTGKAPKAGDKWQIRPDQPPIWVTQAAKTWSLNTGIVCNGLRAIDFDIDDAVIADAVRIVWRNMLPAGAPMRYRRDSPRFLAVYRAATGEPPKVTLQGELGKIEVLGKGNQFVAYGQHYASLAELQWDGRLQQLDQLPTVTEEQLTAFLKACAPILLAGEPQRANGADHKPHHANAGNFTPDPSWPSILDLAAELWGPPTSDNGEIVRFGSRGSKCVWPADNAWHDHEDEKSGGYFDLHRMARGADPPKHSRPGTGPRDDVPPVGDEPGEDKPPEPVFTVTNTVRTADQLPRRPWLAAPYLMRGQITLLHGPGGAGKSQLAIAWAIAAILGVTFGRLAPAKPARVLMLNLEDDMDEQDRRINATVQFFSATVHNLAGNLFRLSTTHDATFFVINPQGTVTTTPAWHEFVQLCETIRPDLICLDPLIAINATTENESAHARRVVLLLTNLIRRLNAALVLAGHDRKGGIDGNDQEAARGSSDWTAGVRFEKAVRIMTPEDAKRFAIDEDRRGYYFRAGSESSKVNYAPPDAAEWFERLAIDVNGEQVVRCEPWQPPSDTVSPIVADQIVELIAKGSRFGPYSPQIGNTNRSLGPELTRLGIEGTRAQNRVLRALQDEGRVLRCKYRRGHGTDTRIGLRSEDGQPDNYQWEE